jgi:hypothetical protein
VPDIRGLAGSGGVVSYLEIQPALGLVQIEFPSFFMQEDSAIEEEAR